MQKKYKNEKNKNKQTNKQRMNINNFESSH